MNFSTLSSSSSSATDPNAPGGIKFVATHTEQVEWVGGLSRPGATKDRYIETDLHTQTVITSTTTTIPSLTTNEIIKPLHERLAEARAKAEEEQGDDNPSHNKYSLPKGLDEEDIEYLNDQEKLQYQLKQNLINQEELDKLEYLQAQERLHKEQEKQEQERLQKLIGITKVVPNTSNTTTNNSTKTNKSSLPVKIIMKGNSSITTPPTTATPTATPSITQEQQTSKRMRSDDLPETNDTKRSHTTISEHKIENNTHSTSPAQTIPSSPSVNILPPKSNLPAPVFAKKDTISLVSTSTNNDLTTTKTSLGNGLGGGLVDYDTSSSSSSSDNDN